MRMTRKRIYLLQLSSSIYSRFDQLHQLLHNTWNFYLCVKTIVNSRVFIYKQMGTFPVSSGMSAMTVFDWRFLYDREQNSTVTLPLKYGKN